MKLKANAKINLYLDVLDKRKDGYHNIETVFQEVSLADDIFICSPRIYSGVSTANVKNGIKILCNNPKIPTNKKNLVYKAAELIKKHFKIKKDVEIKIIKRIPVGAGLGGGSSDASAVLKGLNKLWNLKLSKKTLMDMAKKIGADVPFFIEGGRCFAAGIGDVLMQLPVKRKEWYVIVKPAFSISTKFAYSKVNYRLPPHIISTDFVKFRAKHGGKLCTGLTNSKKIDKIKNYYNKLENAVITLYPEIKRIKKQLVSYGADYSLMSGSGSCVFGAVKNKKEGQKVKNRIKKDGYSVWLVHTV